MAKRTQPPRPPATPPASSIEGAAHVRDFVVKLYDRQDGQGVDWRVIAQTLFRASFDVLDRLPDDGKKSVAANVHEASYKRMTDDISPDPEGSALAALPSGTSILKAPSPHPLG